MSRRNIRKSGLRILRDGLNGGRGSSAAEVAGRIARFLGEDSRSGASIVAVEHRGTRDYYLIEALSQVYGRPREEIARLSNPNNFKTASNILGDIYN